MTDERKNLHGVASECVQIFCSKRKQNDIFLTTLLQGHCHDDALFYSTGTNDHRELVVDLREEYLFDFHPDKNKIRENAAQYKKHQGIDEIHQETKTIISKSEADNNSGRINKETKKGRNKWRRKRPKYYQDQELEDSLRPLHDRQPQGTHAYHHQWTTYGGHPDSQSMEEH
jgi:hypothetical protein